MYKSQRDKTTRMEPLAPRLAPETWVKSTLAIILASSLRHANAISCLLREERRSGDKWFSTGMNNGRISSLTIWFGCARRKPSHDVMYFQLPSATHPYMFHNIFRLNFIIPYVYTSNFIKFCDFYVWPGFDSSFFIFYRERNSGTARTSAIYKY